MDEKGKTARSSPRIVAGLDDLDSLDNLDRDLDRKTTAIATLNITNATTIASIKVLIVNIIPNPLPVQYPCTAHLHPWVAIDFVFEG